MNFLYVIVLRGAVWMTLLIGEGSAETLDREPSRQIQGRYIAEVSTQQYRLDAAEQLGEYQLFPSATEFKMVELLIVACRQESCRKVSLLYDQYELSLMTCMIVGQQEAARWKTFNPDWEIKRWSCGFVGSSEKTV